MCQFSNLRLAVCRFEIYQDGYRLCNYFTMFLYSDLIKLGPDFVTCSYALQCISDSIKLGPDFVTCSYALQCISDSIKLGPDFVTCSYDIQCISKKEDSLKLIKVLLL